MDVLPVFACLCLAFAVSGCSNQGYSVIAATSTVIGVSLGQQPANGSLEATLGYKRAELAFVPTNRNSGENAGSTHEGARDSANVIMELKYSGPFSTSAESGIYQRLAVGDIAVQQGGANILFAKGPDGKVDATAAQALASIQALPLASPPAERAKADLSRLYLDSQKKNDPPTLARFDAAAKTFGYTDYKDFATNPKATLEQAKAVRAILEAQGVKFN
jgi:hypothetical protein